MSLAIGCKCRRIVDLVFGRAMANSLRACNQGPKFFLSFFFLALRKEGSWFDLSLSLTLLHCSNAPSASVRVNPVLNENRWHTDTNSDTTHEERARQKTERVCDVGISRVEWKGKANLARFKREWRNMSQPPPPRWSLLCFCSDCRTYAPRPLTQPNRQK